MTIVHTTLVGYLDDTYLDAEYMSGVAGGNVGIQFTASILDSENPIGVQFGSGVEGALNPEGVQFEGSILDTENPVGLQFTAAVGDAKPVGFQFEAIASSTNPIGVEFKGTELHHTSCSGYLQNVYLENPYLGKEICGNLGIEFFSAIADSENPIGLQFDAIISDPVPIGVQFEGAIDAEEPIGIEFTSVRTGIVGFQFTSVIYNTTNLRILCEFPSRGTSGTNWTATSTATGDFDVDNLNTDIVEQVWRSVSGVTTVNVDCDTEIPQGVFLDTMAMLNHNLTTSATVTLQGSINSSFSPVGISHNITVETTNSYFIADTLPNAGYRYWRFVISDPTNPDTFVSIGTIVFGASNIFQGECFVDRVRKGKTHFKDELFTEGHTNVQNDRGVKNNLSLEFRSIDYEGGNFTSISNVFNFARTNLKCLWIPVPKSKGILTASRFAMFAKMSEIPEEEHNFKNASNDHVDFQVNLDESL